MAEVLLNQPQRNTGFEQMRGVAMPQRVRRNPLAEVDLPRDLFDRPLHSRDRHRSRRLRPSFHMRHAAMIPSISRKHKRPVLMCQPERPQHQQRRLRQRNVAILRALAAVNMHHHAFRVNISDVQIQRFLQPQAEGVHRPEEDRHPLRPATVDDLMHLLDRQHFRQRLHVLNLHLRQRLPLAATCARVEEFHAGERDAQRAAGELLVILQMQKELSQLIFADLIGRKFAEVRQLANSSQVALMRPLRHPAEVQIFAHALIQRPVEVWRMREPSFAVGCFASRLDLAAFSVESPVVVVVLRRIVIRRGHVKISLSETVNGASSDAPTTDRMTCHHCQTLQLPVTIRRHQPPPR